MRTDPFLVVGLGNPGSQYERNRHNVGFQIIDMLANRHGLAFTSAKQRALVADGRIAGERIMLAKPTTYMNDSGEAVGPLVRYFNIPLDQLLVVYDDLDLPLGTLRLRPGGGAGGHRGMASIITHLGTQEFPRLRVGIDRPPGRIPPRAYVLQNFDADEEAEMAITRREAADAVELWVTHDIDTVMNRIN